MDLLPKDLKKCLSSWLMATLTALAICIVLALLFPALPCGVGGKGAAARSDVLQLATSLKAYETEYGGFPKGPHVQIIDAIRGNNPRRVPFFDAWETRLNQAGEYLDPWKSPYRIDVSSKRPLVYSIGKNRIDEGGQEGSDDVSSWR